jgi:maleylacetoacetate isomerase/maleylpyruvate isomerase
MSERILYGYFRSSAAYRVRIALNLKELAYRQQAVNLRAGEQLEVMFQELNPQGLVPVLLDGDLALTQSLAICEYLDEAYPETPRLLPGDAVQRARARAIAQLIACDIHPLNNLRVLSYLDDALGVDKTEQGVWYRHWVATGFDALERLLPEAGGFCLRGDRPTLADICLVPQVFNAKRFNVPMEAYPNITRIYDMLEKLPAFAKAHPAQQPDFL